MRKLTMSKKDSGTARAVAKTVSCMLSIMLVVTGIVPGFAAENKASKQNGEKVVVSDSTSKKPEDSV